MLYRRKANSLITTSNIGKERVKYTLIFGEAKHLVWLNRFLKKGFSHVSIVVHYPHYSVFINPRLAYNEVQCFAGDVKIEPAEGETVLRGDAMVDIYKIRRLLGPLNCVETVKAFIGERSFWCFTPYQLYKRIK